jgi:hypothetical protein
MSDGKELAGRATEETGEGMTGGLPSAAGLLGVVQVGKLACRELPGT